MATYNYGIPVSATAITREGNSFYLNKPLNQPGLLVVFMQGCKYCKILQSAIADVKQFGNVDVFQIRNTDAPASLWQSMRIKGFPTVFVITRKNELRLFQGDRNDWKALQAAVHQMS